MTHLIAHLLPDLGRALGHAAEHLVSFLLSPLGGWTVQGALALWGGQ